jgi:hypothetical protein
LVGRPGKGPTVALVLAAVVFVGCESTNDREAQCREKGLVPGTAEMAACKNPAEAEAVMKAKASWSTLDRGR